MCLLLIELVWLASSNCVPSCSHPFRNEGQSVAFVVHYHMCHHPVEHVVRTSQSCILLNVLLTLLLIVLYSILDVRHITSFLNPWMLCNGTTAAQ